MSSNIMINDNIRREEMDYFDKLSFSTFCEACENIISRIDKKKKFKFFREFTNYHRNKCGGDSFYPLLRLFLPQLERERGAYGVKEYNLACTYIRILFLPKTGQDAQRLLNFRNPSNARTSDIIGDFAEVAYWILRNKSGKSTNITIGEINYNLDAIAQKHAAHEPRAVDDILTSLFRKMSAEEQKWFIRIILKNMHLGLSTKQILYIHHPDSSEVFDFSSSLLKVCTMLNNPTVRLHELEINLFEAVRPMLSERKDIAIFDFTETLLHETKFDGERLQLHVSRGKFKYFSRNGYDYTTSFGEDEYNGHFTAMVKKQFSPSIESVILDGECLGWNTKTLSMVTKASNIDVKHLKVGNTVQPFFVVFDILYYNGEVVTNKTLMERKSMLENTFTDLEGTIIKAPYRMVSTKADVIQALNFAIDQCEEGLILKKPESIYKPNSRSAGWFKIKPEYTDGALVELDLLILGGYYGQGKQKGKVSQFLMGLAVPGIEGEHPTQFESLCRVGSGYSMPELGELSNKLASSWCKRHPGSIPETHLLSKEKPDVWILPQNSCILQIKATEVVKSNAYHNGSTLKFVRVEKIRYDKPWYDCMTSQEFQVIKQAYLGKLTSGPIERLRKNARGKKKYQVETLRNDSHNLKSTEPSSDILQSKEFCVVSGYKDLTKQDIENIIVRNGGCLKYVPGSETYCLIAGDVNLRVKNFVRSGKHTIAHFSWLQDCLEKKRLVEWTPLTLAGTTLMGKSELCRKYDKFGDSYTDDVSTEELANILDKMKIEVFLSATSIKAMDSLLYCDVSPYALFRGVHAYFVLSPTVDKSRRMDLAKALFKFYGGICSNCINESTELLIVDVTCDSLCNCKVSSCPLNKYVEMSIVSSSWIIDSIASEERLHLTDFMVDLNETRVFKETSASLS